MSDHEIPTEPRRPQKPPNYDKLNCMRLRQLLGKGIIAERGLTRKAQYIEALRDRDVQKMAKFEEQMELYQTRMQAIHHGQTNLHRRPQDMLLNKYTADPTRKSFFDLPGELRNKIYELAIFDYELNDKKTKEHVTPSYSNGWGLNADGTEHFPWKLFYRSADDIWWARSGRAYTDPRAKTVWTLFSLLCSMNRQIRREAQAIFWGHVDFTLQGINPGPGLKDYYGVVESLLRFIGPDGQAVIPELKINSNLRHQGVYTSLDLGVTGHMQFERTLGLVAECKNLHSFNIDLAMSHLLREDQPALKNYFVRGTSLNTSGFPKFAAMLRLMENLHTVCLTPIRRWEAGNRATHVEEQPFLHFAFSGMRELFLWHEFSDYFNANGSHSVHEDVRKFDKVIIWLEMPHLITYEQGNDVMDYQTWLPIRPAQSRTANIPSHAIVIDISDDDK